MSTLKLKQKPSRIRPVMPPQAPFSTATIIGLGNWGTSLVAALVSAGIPIGEVVVRTLISPEKNAGLPLTMMSNAALDAPLIWLSVPDGAIEATAAALVARCHQQGRDLTGQTVLHSSGALTTAALAPARKAGAQVASLAPLMTFPTRKPVPLEGVPFAVESMASGRRKLFRLVSLLGGVPFRLDSQNKILYHAAATMASPLLLSALMASLRTAALAGLSPQQAKDLLAPMAAATLANFISGGAEKSFSGAFARGDVRTVELHLEALARHPILAGSYRSLAINALECLPSRNVKKLLEVLVQSADSKQVAAR